MAAQPMPGGQAVPQPTNWLAEWSNKTPIVVRYSVFVVLGATLISYFAGISDSVSLIPIQVTEGVQLWRMITCFFNQGGIFTLLFVVLMLATQMPAQEYRMGSIPFLWHLFTLGSLINVIYVILSMLFYLIPWTPIQYFAFMPSQGLWPILMATITANVLTDPTGSSTFLCFTLNNRIYPWFLVGLFSLISFFPLLDLALGAAVGHLYTWGYLKRFALSARRVAALETNGGAVVRTGMTRKIGFVYGPETVIPPGSAALDREAAAAQWAMFDPVASRRLAREQQERQARQQGGGDGAGGGGDAESGPSPYMFRAGRGGGGAASSGGGGGGGASGGGATGGGFAAFGGSGRPLGVEPTTSMSSASGNGAASASSSSSSSVSVTSVLSSILGRGSGTTSTTSSGAGATGVSAATNTAAADERRKAAAAAAEARLYGARTRGAVSDSTTATAPTKSSVEMMPSTRFHDDDDFSSSSSAIPTGSGKMMNPILAPASARSIPGADYPASSTTTTTTTMNSSATPSTRNGGKGEKQGLLSGDDDDDDEDENGVNDTQINVAPTSVSSSSTRGNSSANGGKNSAVMGMAAAARLRALEANARGTAPTTTTTVSSSSPSLSSYAGSSSSSSSSNTNTNSNSTAHYPGPLSTLVDMGFDRAAAANALAQTQGDIEAAVLLLSA